MEQKNYYQKAETIIKELESKTQMLFSEILYLKMHITSKNERTFMESSGLMMLRLKDVALQVQKVLSLNIDILKEMKVPKDDAMILSQQLGETNSEIIRLSNAITNSAYFIRMNSVE